MKRIAAVALAVSLTACSMLPRPRILGPSAEEQREYDAAVAAARRDSTQGRGKLAAFIDRNPDSALADDAVVLLARLEVKAGRPQVAEKRLADVLRAHPKED